MPITSSRNSLLQDVRRAAAAGRPTEEGLIVAEGPHLAEEACRGTWTVEQILVAESHIDTYSELLYRAHGSVIEVAERAFSATAATQAHQGIIVLLRPRKWTWGDLTKDDLTSPRPLIVVLDGIQDPGNAGTLVRSAEAFGATAAVLLRGSVGVANGKFLRAAAGSAFRVPLLENIPPEALLSYVREQKITLYGLTARAQENLLEADLTVSSGLVLGSEGAGISSAIQGSVLGLRVPMQAVESLNVGIAGSIALFEAARQRKNLK